MFASSCSNQYLSYKKFLIKHFCEFNNAIFHANMFAVHTSVGQDSWSYNQGYNDRIIVYTSVEQDSWSYNQGLNDRTIGFTSVWQDGWSYNQGYKDRTIVYTSV